MTARIFACSCETPRPAVEFYQSEYVFEGKVIEKVYDSDSLTYTVIFEISKHYKHGENPEFLKFKLSSEGEITGQFTSCDWNVEKGEKWLVYARKFRDKLTFSYYCSNSKIINERYIQFEEQKVLNNGNEINLYKYRHTFNNAKTLINIDSILENYRKERFKPSSFAPIIIDVNKEGELTNANLFPRKNYEKEVVDTIFGLNLIKNKHEPPKSEFQNLALEIARKLDKWQQYYYLDLKYPVRYRTILKFGAGKDSIIKLEK